MSKREKIIEITSDLSLDEMLEVIKDLETLIALKKAKIAHLKKTLDKANQNDPQSYYIA